MNYVVTINLISDLCSSNGSTKGRMIDTDVCLDGDGLPYIPAKRIKGVLLQAYLDYVDITGQKDESEGIFGEEDGEREAMYVGDAKIEKEGASDPTYYRTQIRIDDDTGTTSGGSLRTLMVVKRGTKFSFELEINANRIDTQVLEKVLSLVTHIGLNRNRGFGEVKLELKNGMRNQTSLDLSRLADSKTYRYDILCKSLNDILLPEANSEISGSVIPGSSLYGFFAYQYIKNANCADPTKDPVFMDIFYNDGVRFSFGFISDADGRLYYPLPSCIQRGKNTDLYRLALARNEAIQNGGEEIVKFKSLKSKFGSFDLDGGKLELKDVDFRINYHHQRDKGEMGKGLVKEANFFQYKAIASGQYFKFSLEGSGRYLKTLLENLTYLHIGKSRTAQYGTLEICGDKKSRYTEINGEAELARQANYYLACVETPIILNHKNVDGEIDNLDLDLFMSALNKECGGLGVADACYSLSRKLVSGFNMVWKKRKPTVYAIAPESYVLLKSSDGKRIPSVLYVGKRNAEGFGRLRIVPIDKKGIIKLEIRNLDSGSTSPSLSAFDVGLKAKKEAIEEFPKSIKIDPGLLSRMLLMLRQVDSYGDFVKNIDGITDDKKRSGAKEIVRRYEEKFPFDREGAFMPYFFTLLTLMKYEKRSAKE